MNSKVYEGAKASLSISGVKVADLGLITWTQESGQDFKPRECDHEFKEYIGLFEAYRFCTKCDKKLCK